MKRPLSDGEDESDEESEEQAAARRKKEEEADPESLFDTPVHPVVLGYLRTAAEKLLRASHTTYQHRTQTSQKAKALEGSHPDGCNWEWLNSVAEYLVTARLAKRKAWKPRR